MPTTTAGRLGPREIQTPMDDKETPMPTEHYEPRHGDRITITYPPNLNPTFEGVVDRDCPELPAFCLHGTNLRTGESIGKWFCTDARAKQDGLEQITRLIASAEGPGNAR